VRKKKIVDQELVQKGGRGITGSRKESAEDTFDPQGPEQKTQKGKKKKQTAEQLLESLHGMMWGVKKNTHNVCQRGEQKGRARRKN